MLVRERSAGIDDDQPIILERAGLEPFLSAYLMGGIKQDAPYLERVTVRDKHAEGIAGMQAFYVSESDNRFHLSMLMGTLLVTQVGVVHALVVSGCEKKSFEVYMSDFAITLNRQITTSSGVQIALDVVNKIVVPASSRRKTPRSFFRWHFKIGDDQGAAWSGTITLVFPF